LSSSWIAIVATIFAMISWGSLLQAQQSDTQQPAAPQTQQPAQPQQPPDAQAPAQPPESQQSPSQGRDQTQSGQGQASQPSDAAGGSSEYVGTVVKEGDKYMFQDAASGQTYDIDHQDQVKKFEGKKVRVRGTLDPSTKTIHVQ
jgi:hypothetical protein